MTAKMPMLAKGDRIGQSCYREVVMAMPQETPGGPPPSRPGCGPVNLILALIPGAFLLVAASSGWQAGGWVGLLAGIPIGLLAAVAAFLVLVAVIALTLKLFSLTDPDPPADGADPGGPPPLSHRGGIVASFIIAAVWGGLAAAILKLFDKPEERWQGISLAILLPAGLILVFGGRWLPPVFHVNRRRPVVPDWAKRRPPVRR